MPPAGDGIIAFAERLQHLFHGDLQQAGIRMAGVRVARRAVPEDVVTTTRRRPPEVWGRRSEEDDGWRAERGGQVCDSGITAHDSASAGHLEDQCGEGCSAG